jgi:Catechol dioxygenase N terminus
MTAVVRHVHELAREVRLTEAEWMAASRRATRRREKRAGLPLLRTLAARLRPSEASAKH